MVYHHTILTDGNTNYDINYMYMECYLRNWNTSRIDRDVFMFQRVRLLKLAIHNGWNVNYTVLIKPSVQTNQFIYSRLIRVVQTRLFTVEEILQSKLKIQSKADLSRPLSVVIVELIPYYTTPPPTCVSLN